MSFDHAAFFEMRQKQILKSSRQYRQRAIAEFPLRVMDLANDLKKLCDAEDKGMPISTDTLNAMAYKESEIAEVFYEMFGKTIVDVD